MYILKVIVLKEYNIINISNKRVNTNDTKRADLKKTPWVFHRPHVNLSLLIQFSSSVTARRQSISRSQMIGLTNPGSTLDKSRWVYRNRAETMKLLVWGLVLGTSFAASGRFSWYSSKV